MVRDLDRIRSFLSPRDSDSPDPPETKWDIGEVDIGRPARRKGFFDIYPPIYAAASCVTVVIVAIPVWLSLLTLLDYLTVTQATAFRFPIELLSFGNSPSDVGLAVYGLFGVSLTLGSLVSSWVWYHLAAPGPVREHLRLPTSIGLTALSASCLFGIAAVVGPVVLILLVLLAMGLLLLAQVAIIGFLMVPYGLYTGNEDLTKVGFWAIGYFVAMGSLAFLIISFPAVESWAVQTPILASIYVISIVLAFVVPASGPFESLPLVEWGQREFLYRLLSARVDSVVDTGDVGAAESPAVPNLASVVEFEPGGSAFVVAAEMLDAIESLERAISEVEEMITNGDLSRASNRLCDNRSLIERIEDLEPEAAVFIDGSRAEDRIAQRFSDLKSDHAHLETRLERVQEDLSTVRGEIEGIDEQLEVAETLVDTNELDQCRTALNAVSSDIRHVDQAVNRDGIQANDVIESISEFKRRHESLMSDLEGTTAAYESIQGRIGELESQLRDTEDALKKERPEEAKAEVMSIQSQLRSVETKLDTYRFEDLDDRVERLSRECDSHLNEANHLFEQRVSQHREGADKLLRDAEGGTEQEIMEDYDQALAELEEASDIAAGEQIDGAKAIEGRIQDLERKRDGLYLKMLGGEVADVQIPDPISETTTPGDFSSAIQRLDSLLETLEGTDTTRGTELELVVQEANSRLRGAQLDREHNRARRAGGEFRVGNHEQAAELFETARQNLRQAETAWAGDDTSESVQAMRKLAEVCDWNGSVVKRADLGLLADPELKSVDPDKMSSPDGPGLEVEPTSGGPMPRRSEGVNLDGAPKDGPDYDDFERGALIGSGGNADVYRSTLMLDDTPRPVAMKEPRIQGTVLAESTEMFAAEARTWSRLDNHANIVTVVAYGSSPIPWIALEYMDQGDLSTVSSELSLQDKLRIAIQITDAVWHAHQRGVAHLDLKPQNILLEAGDGDSNLMAKVADWGLSRMLLENSASVEGLSPQYSAPEQFDAEKYGSPDNQTDIFQLGVILYELFAGQHPFGNSATEAMHGILNEATVPLGIHDPDLPVEVEDAVGPALAKSKVDRYEAVVYLRDALESIRSSAE